jgi:hypothetical protein
MALPFVVIDEAYSTAVVDCADLAQSKDDPIRRCACSFSVDSVGRAPFFIF